MLDYIPTDPIPEENRWASSARNLGLTKWYMLYNPRQLYVLAKLAQYIARRTEEIMREDPEFGAAVALYLVFGFDKEINYNTIATSWHRSRATIRDSLGGAGIRSDYCEVIVPWRSLKWALEPEVAEKGEFMRTGGGVLPVLGVLCDWFRERKLGDRTIVFLADATKLSSIMGEGSLDIVNVDPPYFEQVVYSDKIEFIWVLMRRALSPALDILFPEERVRIDWSPKGEKGARLPRKRELVVRGKSRSEFREGDTEIENWRTLFKELCTDFAKVLKDDGILVLWFTHPSDIAWRSVGEALYDAGFVTSKVYPMFSEMPTRYKGQVNKVAQQISLAIVAKKASRERLMGAEDMAVYLASEERFSSLADRLASEALSMARSTRLSTVDAFALTLGTAISVATHFDAPIKDAFKDLYSAAITQVIERFVGGLLKDLFTGERPVRLVPDEAEVVEGRIQEGMLHEPAARAYMPRDCSKFGEIG